MEKKKIKKIVFGIIILSILIISFVLILNQMATNYYLSGVAYQSQGYYEKAKESFEKSVRLKENPIVFNALGNLNWFLGENLEAVKSFQLGIESDENDVENFYDLSRVYVELEQYNKAEETILTILNEKEESASIYSLLGSVYIHKGEWDKAEKYLKKSLVLQERAETYNDLGVVYDNMGNYDLAIQSYEDALQINPDFKLARTNLEKIK